MYEYTVIKYELDKILTLRTMTATFYGLWLTYISNSRKKGTSVWVYVQYIHTQLQVQ